LRRIGRTAAERLGDLGRAFAAQARALKEDPSNCDARAELEYYAQESGAWGALEGIYSEIAAGVTEVDLAREYWLRLAGIEERLDKVEEAAAGYGHVLSLDPSDQEALAALDSLYRRTGRWEDLIGVYRKRIELMDDLGEREGLYAQMAQVYEGQLGRPGDAIGAYQEVLALDENSLVALVALDALFMRQEMWVELAANLDAQLRLVETQEQESGLMLRLGALRELKMGEVELAIDTYRQVLESHPGSVEALSALERLGGSPEHELTVAEILEPLYRQVGDFGKLIGVHEVQVRRTDDAVRRVELLHQISSLYEDAGGDLNAAFDTLARALAEDPSNEDTQGVLDRLARATSRFLDLAQVYEALAGVQSDAFLASHLYSIAAHIFECELGDVDNAVRHYRKVLDIDAGNLAAAEALEGLFRGSERYADLSVILQKKADIIDEPEDKKAALFQAAAIEEQMLERPEEAIKVYLRALDVDPEDLRAVDALIVQYLGMSRWEDLLGVYTRKVDLVFASADKKSIYYEMGAVYESQLGDVPRAIDTYQRVLELDPDDMQALGRLDVLYQASESWSDLLGVLQRESDLMAGGYESISYQYRIAELYASHLDDVVRAIELYREILTQQPDHEMTLGALERLKDGEVEPLAAALVLEPFYEGAEQWLRLISVLEVQVRFQDDSFMQVDLLHRIAMLYEECLGDHVAAFDTHARALSLDNTNQETLASLERLAGVAGRWVEAAGLYDLELGKLGDNPDWFVELGLRAAAIYETQIEDMDSAVSRYRRVLEVVSDNEQALNSLDRLFEMMERWGDLAGVLLQEAEVSSDPDQVLDYRFRLGQVYQYRLDDIDKAVAAYRDVMVAMPEHEHALLALERLFGSGVKQAEIGEILEPLYTDNAQWEKLAGVHEAQLVHLGFRRIVWRCISGLRRIMSIICWILFVRWMCMFVR